MEYIFLIKIKIYQELLIKDTSRDVNNDYTTHMSMLLSIRVLSILLCFVGESDIECAGHRHLIQLSWDIYSLYFH